MQYARTTQVPNSLFDVYLTMLKVAQLKILLVILRQTNGWIDAKTGKRKVRDRISHSQFMLKTGLSRRIISITIQDLIELEIVRVTNSNNEELRLPQQRKGRFYLYYQCMFQHVQSSTLTYVNPVPAPVQKATHNKTKNLTKTKNVTDRREITRLIQALTRKLQSEN